MFKKLFHKVPVAAVFVVIFLDFFSLGLTIPNLPTLFKDLDRNALLLEGTLLQGDMLYALVSGIFFLGAFFGTPIVGALSDRYGRKPLLLATTTIGMLCYMLVGASVLAHSIVFVFIGRVAAGLCGSVMTIINSSLADISTKETKAKNFGLTGVAFGTAFIFSVLVGGLLSNPEISKHFDFHVPFFAAGLVQAVNLLFIFYFYNETNKSPHKVNLSILSGFKNIIKAFRVKALRSMFTIIFVLALGFSLFILFFPVYLIDKFKVDATELGIVLGYMGVWVAFSQGFMLRLATKYIPAYYILLVSIPLLALSYLLLMLPNDFMFMFLVVPFFTVFQGLTFPSTLAFVSNQVSEKVQGEVIGINQSVMALASAITPIFYGILLLYIIYCFKNVEPGVNEFEIMDMALMDVTGWAVSAKKLIMNMPLIFGGICSGIAWLIYLCTIKKKDDATTSAT